MAALAREAGLLPARWDSFLFYRVALTAVPPAGAVQQHVQVDTAGYADLVEQAA
jgi:hypothetical protein